MPISSPAVGGDEGEESEGQVGRYRGRREALCCTIGAEEALPVDQEANMAELVAKGGIHGRLAYLGRKACC